MVRSDQKIEPQGHWYLEKKQTSVVPDYEYYCACGYMANNLAAIEGHVTWELEKMKAVVSGVMAQPMQIVPENREQ